MLSYKRFCLLFGIRSYGPEIPMHSAADLLGLHWSRCRAKGNRAHLRCLCSSPWVAIEINKGFDMVAKVADSVVTYAEEHGVPRVVLPQLAEANGVSAPVTIEDVNAAIRLYDNLGTQNGVLEGVEQRAIMAAFEADPLGARSAIRTHTQGLRAQQVVKLRTQIAVELQGYESRVQDAILEHQKNAFWALGNYVEFVSPTASGPAGQTALVANLVWAVSGSPAVSVLAILSANTVLQDAVTEGASVEYERVEALQAYAQELRNLLGVDGNASVSGETSVLGGVSAELEEAGDDPQKLKALLGKSQKLNALMGNRKMRRSLQVYSSLRQYVIDDSAVARAIATNAGGVLARQDLEPQHRKALEVLAKGLTAIAREREELHQEYAPYLAGTGWMRAYPRLSKEKALSVEERLALREFYKVAGQLFEGRFKPEDLQGNRRLLKSERVQKKAKALVETFAQWDKRREPLIKASNLLNTHALRLATVGAETPLELLRDLLTKYARDNDHDVRTVLVNGKLKFKSNSFVTLRIDGRDIAAKLSSLPPKVQLPIRIESKRLQNPDLKLRQEHSTR